MGPLLPCCRLHKFSFVFIQATVAILILVGFESVTSMGAEAKNPTKHIPIAVIASLLIRAWRVISSSTLRPTTS